MQSTAGVKSLEKTFLTMMSQMAPLSHFIILLFLHCTNYSLTLYYVFVFFPPLESRVSEIVIILLSSELSAICDI